MTSTRKALDVKNLDSKDPFKQFDCWLQEAKKNPNINEPNAVCLTTSTPEGDSSCRMMQIQSFDKNGFLFFTNYTSKKAQDIETNPKASMCFFWDPLARQVIIKGKVKRISRQEAIEYFKKCSIETKIRSYVSEQGKVIKDKQALIDKQSQLREKLEKNPEDITAPENWGGFLLVPEEFEFWQRNVNELDDRIRFRVRQDKEDENLITFGEGNWIIERVSP